MRGLDSIFQQLRISLQNSNSLLTDFTPQGVTYTLLRGIASGIQQIEANYYDPLLAAADFTKATGVDLETFANLFGLSRQPSAVSSGYVLVTGARESAISAGTVFTDLQSGNQYIANNPESIAISIYTEVAVPVRAALTGAGKDLPAGTKLFSQSADILEVVVGFERKYDGTACGNIEGGGRVESDDSLRNRMYSLLRAGGLMNKAALRSLIVEHPAVTDALITTTSPGVVEVLVKTDNVQMTALAEDLKALVESYLVAAVVKVNIQQPTPIRVDMSVAVEDFTDLNQLKETIRSEVESYVILARNSLYFDPREIEALILPYVTEVQVNTPADPLEWSSRKFLELGDLNVSLKI